MKKICFIIFSILLAVNAEAALKVYPAGEGVATLNDYTVSVRQLPEGDWETVDVYPVRVDEVIDAKHNARVASMAYFDFEGEVEVKVTPNYTEIESARIRPLSYNIPYEKEGESILFKLSEPSNLSVEFNGDIFRNLHLFANPMDQHRPTPKEIKKRKDLIYFGPGYHEIEGRVIRVPSNTTVYVDGGAYVDGQLVADGVENVKFYGRGEVRPDVKKDGNVGISIRNSKNIEAEGVIVSQIPVGGSDSVQISNVKSISHYGWGDGMNVFASNNVNYDRVFCRNSDDCTTVYATRKGFVGGCENIKMENSTLWADVAHPIMVGLHGSATEIGVDAAPDTIQNIVYRNIDILDHAEKQLDYQGCMAINCGDNNVVKDVLFEDIRVEDFRQGQLFNIRIFFNDKYCKAPGTSVSDIVFKDITYNGKNSEISLIAGYDDSRKVSDITFENLVVNGQKISDDMPGKPKWYKTGDMGRIFIGEHVEGVQFK